MRTVAPAGSRITTVTYALRLGRQPSCDGTVPTAGIQHFRVQPATERVAASGAHALAARFHWPDYRLEEGVDRAHGEDRILPVL
jgi:hypothetical protein